MSYKQTVSHVTAAQGSAGGVKAAGVLNQVNSNSQYTNFGRKPVPAPKPVAGKSVAKGSTELASLQSEWNELCNLFGWKGTGGRRTKTRARTRGRTRTQERRKRTKSRKQRSRR